MKNYERLPWEDIPTAANLTAANLNHIEAGIAAVTEEVTKVDNKVYIASKNLLSLPEKTDTVNEVKISVKDNVINVNRMPPSEEPKPESDESILYQIPLDSAFELEAGKYTLSIANLNSSAKGSCRFILQDSSLISPGNIQVATNNSNIPSTLSFDTSENITVAYVLIIIENSIEINQSFSVQLERGETATVYNSPERTFGGNVSRNLDILMDNVLYVRSYGAIGDGQVDDTKAIQAALNDAAATGKKLVFDSGKIYIVNKTLYIDNPLMSIDFNYCTIKAGDSFVVFDSPIESALICINDNYDASTSADIVKKFMGELDGENNTDKKYNPNSELTKQFCNVTLDGNRGQCPTGIRIKHSNKVLYENINIRDFELYGIFIRGEKDKDDKLKSIGSENLFINIHLTNSRVKRYVKLNNQNEYEVCDYVNYQHYLNNASTAIYACCSDAYFDKIVVIDWENAFVNWGSDNYYVNCHAWAGFTENIMDHTVGMLCCSGNIHMDGCCFDSLAYDIYVSGTSRIWLSQAYTCWSQTFLNKTKNVQPCIFFFNLTGNNIITGQAEPESVYKGKALHICNSNIKNIQNGTRNVTFTNLDETHSKITVDNKIDYNFDNLIYKYKINSDEIQTPQIGTFDLTLVESSNPSELSVACVQSASAKYFVLGSTCFLTVNVKMNEKLSEESDGCVINSYIKLTGIPEELYSADNSYCGLGSNCGLPCSLILYKNSGNLYLCRESKDKYLNGEIIMGTMMYQIKQ